MLSNRPLYCITQRTPQLFTKRTTLMRLERLRSDLDSINKRFEAVTNLVPVSHRTGGGAAATAADRKRPDSSRTGRARCGVCPVAKRPIVVVRPRGVARSLGRSVGRSVPPHHPDLRPRRRAVAGVPAVAFTAAPNSGCLLACAQVRVHPFCSCPRQGS